CSTAPLCCYPFKKQPQKTLGRRPPVAIDDSTPRRAARHDSTRHTRFKLNGPCRLSLTLLLSLLSASKASRPSLAPHLSPGLPPPWYRTQMRCNAPRPHPAQIHSAGAATTWFEHKTGAKGGEGLIDYTAGTCEYILYHLYVDIHPFPALSALSLRPRRRPHRRVSPSFRCTAAVLAALSSLGHHRWREQATTGRLYTYPAASRRCACTRALSAL
ncbi:hypothetical protein B0H16DRAFT_1825765, partial [Mycena metata]